MTPRDQLIQSICAEATEWRRELHRNPQTMYEETFASDFIAKKLTEWNIPHERNIAITGIAATIQGRQNNSKRAVAFRADIDALDMPDLSGQPWASQTPGKMHGCGHDGHTATLLALARYLSQTRNFDGTVQLIFQPAEEGGRGALRMLSEGLLDRFPFDEVYGYHNFPGGPFGIFATRPGAMMAAADIFEITLRGAGGHGAMPNTTRDPIPAAAQLVLALQTLVSRETDPMLSAVLSVTNLNAGSGAFNVIPESAKLSGTVRTFDAKLRDHLEKRIGEMAASIAATFRLTSEYTYGRITEPVLNDPESTTHCRAAAAAIVGPDRVVDMPPIMGGEDFGGFLEVRPGAFMGIGQGEDPASPHSQGLHTPQYDFNDAILPLAAGYFAELAERRLPID